MKPRPAPVEGQPMAPPEPSDGNVISTVRVTRTEDAYVPVEHPEGWSEDDVKSALDARMLDFGTKVQFWNAEQRTRVRAIVLGQNEPDDPMIDPFELTDEDLAEDDVEEADEAAAGGA
jgi:hypothetical protein